MNKIIDFILQPIDNIFFKSEEFITLQKETEKMSKEYNELNNYINNTYNNFKDIKAYNYGQSSALNVYDCTLSVYRNAKNKPFKYIQKYFNVEANEENIQLFEDFYNQIMFTENAINSISAKRKEILNIVEEQLPFYMKLLCRQESVLKRLNIPSITIQQKYPEYIFKYTSPGGKTSESFSVILDAKNTEIFIQNLKDEIKNKKSAAKQRALMTKALREKIKKRDNYTCKICGNSIYNEPNLLLEIDHIIPISKGGLTEENNLQTLCWKCNRAKGNKI